MAALVVVDVSRGRDAERSLTPRLDVFPGGATPAVFSADTPFWIGYAFAPDTDERGGSGPVDESTRFELDVDGRPVAVEADVRRRGDVVERKTQYVDFESGLPTGWHSFHGRWYDRGKLLLSSRVSVEFVERCVRTGEMRDTALAGLL